MLLKTLTLTNVRAFKQAEFIFQPGMNLIVGINGVGKSTVLEVIRIVLAKILPKFSLASIERSIKFKADDIKIGENQLTALLKFQLVDTPVQCEFNYSGRTQFELSPNNPAIWNIFKQQVTPLAIYFSPQRAIASMAKSRNIKYGVSTAFIDALKPRELRFTEFADWLMVQENLALENSPYAKKYIEILNSVIPHFLDSLGHPRAFDIVKIHKVRGKPYHRNAGVTISLSIEKSGIGLTVSQLSDGERSILALVLDLTRRLAQANPDLEDPLQAQAVVLIDELDLHLHPQWQRTIVEKLTTTFPNCQFIATTHSPLIIGEVPPENIIIINENGQSLCPDKSFGMDTDWVLKYLMGATTRNRDTEDTLKQIAKLIEIKEYNEATDEIDSLRSKVGEFPEIVKLQAQIDRFQMLGI